MLAQTAPILGKWLPHADWATVVAVLVAVAVIAWGPTVARVTPWRWLVLGTWATSAVWAMSLALIDGWKRGFVGRMGGNSSYLATIPRVTSVPAFIHGFASHIVDGPGSWHISVAGDPPGALLTFVGLDRLGLRGPTWASGFCVVAGTSAAAAVLITIRALSGEDMARRVAPFVALGPVAVWIAVSADAYFGAVAAWGLALLALASARTIRVPTVAAVGAGTAAGLLDLPRLRTDPHGHSRLGRGGRHPQRPAAGRGGRRGCGRGRRRSPPWASGGSTGSPWSDSGTGPGSPPIDPSPTGCGATWPP